MIQPFTDFSYSPRGSLTTMSKISFLFLPEGRLQRPLDGRLLRQRTRRATNMNVDITAAFLEIYDKISSGRFEAAPLPTG